MRILTTILILALFALPSCRHGRTGQQGEPGLNGIGQDGQDGRDGTDANGDRIVVVRGIDGVYLPSYITVSDALPDDLGGLELLVDDKGLLILAVSGIYAVRTRGDALVVLQSVADEGDILGGEIQNSRGRLAVGDTVIFDGLGPKDEK